MEYWRGNKNRIIYPRSGGRSSENWVFDNFQWIFVIFTIVVSIILGISTEHSLMEILGLSIASTGSFLLGFKLIKW